MKGHRRDPEVSDLQLLASFHQLSPSPLIVVNESAKVTFANDAARRPLEPLGPKASPESFLPKDMDNILEHLRRREPATFQREVEVGDRVFEEDIQVRPERDAVFIHANDITELRRAEHELRRQDALLKALVESPTDVHVFALDRNYCYTAFNTAHRHEMKRLFDADVQTGKNVLDIISKPDVRSRIQQTIARALAGESFTSVEFDSELDSWYEFNWNPIHAPSGSVAGVTAFVRDITRRKRVETALAESELKFRRLFESSNDAIVMLDAARFLDCNPAALKVFGYSTREEFLGKHPADVSPPRQADGRDSRVAADEKIAAAFRTGRSYFEWLHLRADGTVFQADVLLTPMEFRGHKVLQATVRDISRRKQAEQQSRAERDRLRRILDVMPDGVYLVDQDYRIEYINPALLARGGPVDGRRCYEYFHGRTEPCSDCANPQVFAGESTHREYTTRQGGVTYDIQDVPITGDDGRPARLVFLRDVTERKRAELRDKQHLEDTALLRDTALGFMTLDKNTDIYRYIAQHLAQLAGEAYIVVNSYDAARGESRVEAIEGIGESAEAVLRLLGRPPAGMTFRYTPEELRNYSGNKLMRVDGGLPALSCGRVPQVVSAAIESVFGVGDVYAMSFYWQNRILGTVNIIMHQGASLRDPAIVEAFVNQAAAAIQHRRDADELVRHRAHLQELVRERTTELEAVNRELEAFSYSVSHDLRAPLRAIDGFTQALVEDCGTQLNGKARADLDRVCSAARRMAQLIDDLLDLARIARLPLERKTVDLSELARSIAAELRQTAPDRKVKFVIPGDLSAPADPVLVAMVLRNLLGNAWKFTSRHPTARIEFGATRGSGERIFFVRDDGVGFDMAYADKLFAPFQRLHTEHEFSGSGIGLAIVQRIVRRHGGRVWFEAEVNGGATCWFTLEPARRETKHGRETRKGNTAD